MRPPPDAADALLEATMELCRLAEQQQDLPFRLSLRRGTLEILVTVTEIDSPAGEPPTPGLSAIDRRVLAVLSSEWQQSPTVARLAGRSQAYVRASLSRLCEAGLAESRARRGYRRKGPAV